MRRRWIALALVAVGGCFQDSAPGHSEFLPLDYKTTGVFKSVRACRPVTAHDNRYEAVFVNAIGADAYLAASYPLPATSVVVAEEHADPSCNSLVGFKLMAKENAGYDSAHGDWHWQQLDANQRLLKDGRLTTCSTCHALSPCSDYLCSQP